MLFDNFLNFSFLFSFDFSLLFEIVNNLTCFFIFGFRILDLNPSWTLTLDLHRGIWRYLGCQELVEALVV